MIILNKEVWKDILNYEGYYMISNKGRVKSLNRKVYAGRNRYRIEYGKILSSNKSNGNGYKVVALNKNSVSQNKYIHRLVAQAFIPNPHNLKYVNHKDENKSNNSVENLEWCTAQYNVTYNELSKRKAIKMKNHIALSKKIYQLNEDGEIIKEFPSISEASRQMNVSFQAISDCLNGKQKHSAGYRWEYVD